MTTTPEPPFPGTPGRADRSGKPSPARPLRDFMATEAAGGGVLIVAAVVAVIWANSPWQAGYRSLWNIELTLGLGHWDLILTLREWVNEGLMSLFFLVIGLEVKRELLHGELRGLRRAALPVVAAFGGMVVPALLYSVVNLGGTGTDGWAIPMATDIAFALGVLVLIAPGLPPGVRAFLLALAIVDDLGAIAVIALFYSGSLETPWLAAAVGTVLLVYLFRHVGLMFTPLFVAIGVVVWFEIQAAGVHPTIAGVVMGLLAPVRGAGAEPPIVGWRSGRSGRAPITAERLEHVLHPWAGLIVVPIFALANAGVTLSGGSVRAALTSPVTLGVVVGLVVGKTVGITAASWIACRAGLAELPSGTGWRDLGGVAILGGIGFTVSLFITELAFGATAFAQQAKVGIFMASIAATLFAALVLRAGRRRAPAG